MGIGYVKQNSGLFPHYTVAENIAVVPKLQKWNSKQIKDRTEELIQKLHLSDDVLNQLIVTFMAKIHLIKSFDFALFFTAVCLDSEQGKEILKQVIQLMDIQSTVDSDQPSVVLTNLALKVLLGNDRNQSQTPEINEIIESTNIDVDMYFDASRAVIGDSVMDSIRSAIKTHFGIPDLDMKKKGFIDLYTTKGALAIVKRPIFPDKRYTAGLDNTADMAFILNVLAMGECPLFVNTCRHS
jgi:hypothetical protein